MYTKCIPKSTKCDRIVQLYMNAAKCNHYYDWHHFPTLSPAMVGNIHCWIWFFSYFDWDHLVFTTEYTRLSYFEEGQIQIGYTHYKQRSKFTSHKYLKFCNNHNISMFFFQYLHLFLSSLITIDIMQGIPSGVGVGGQINICHGSINHVRHCHYPEVSTDHFSMLVHAMIITTMHTDGLRVTKLYFSSKYKIFCHWRKIHYIRAPLDKKLQGK